MKSRTKNLLIKLFFMTSAALFFYILVCWNDFWHFLLGAIFPGITTLIYPQASLQTLLHEHLWMAVGATAMATVVGLAVAIISTRPWSKDFRLLFTQLATLGQTFPPVAILALVIPLVGFGFFPTFLALFIFGLFPIIRNSIDGILFVPAEIKEAASAMGMSDRQMLLAVELPMAARIILAGIRISLVINIGTATLGATVGAGGLGAPIISGLVSMNSAFILQGALVAAFLALIADGFLRLAEEYFSW